MTPLPGVTSTIGDDLPTRSLPGDTGTAFIAGITDRGSVTEPVLIRSLTQYVNTFGPRVSYGTLYDTLDIAFHEGLDHAYVLRAVGPAAVIASEKLKNGSEPTLEIHAVSPGEWGNKITVEVLEAVVEGKFKLHVLYDEVLVESSPELADNTAAVSWAGLNSAYITLKDLGKGDPTVKKSITLKSGADDRASVNAKVFGEVLELFTPDLGGGQVAIPGNYAEDVQEAVEAHCDVTQRVPVPDPEDTEEAVEIIANAGALSAAAGARQGGIFSPWDIAPGITPGTTRTVPPCARQLGAMARVDAETGNPNTAAAGDLGKARYVIGLSQKFSDADREALNEAGVNVSIMDEGVPTTYGWRTLADPVNDPNWVPLSTARLMTSFAHGAKKVLKRSLFTQLDAQGETVAKAEGKIINEVLKPAYLARAVYGLTEAEAYSVTVEEEISPTDGSVAKLTAVIAARPTKFAEVIEVTVVATNEAL